MDRILKIQKKENGSRASSAPALELNTIIFKHVYWYMQQISGESLQDHWSSGWFSHDAAHLSMYCIFADQESMVEVYSVSVVSTLVR